MENVDTSTRNLDSMTYKGYLFILRVAEQGVNCLGGSKEEILGMMMEIQQLLSLNELEITLWAIYLEKFGWLGADTMQKKLLYTAYTSKAVLNEDISSLKQKIIEKFACFTGYEAWIIQYRTLVSVGYIELNYTYAKLSKVDNTAEEIDSYDYNIAVTQLIENSTRPEKQES